MIIKLVLADRNVKHLIEQLGEDKVTILERGEEVDGYSYVQFEVTGYSDVLHVFHAGTNSGLELGLYGPKGKPAEKEIDLVELERG